MSTPAGWYPNPDGDGRQRYWDGSAWTDHFHDTPAAKQEPELPAGTLWSATGKPLTGVGAGRYRLDAHYLYFERGALRTDSQQVPISSVHDVDVAQTMAQKARGVGNLTVKVQRSTGMETVVLADIPNFREGQRVINDTAHEARRAIQQNANTHRYEGAHPMSGPSSTPAPAATPAADADPIAQLERLGKLRDAGVLTDEEFATQKATILSRM